MTSPCMSISSIAGARPFGMWSHPWDSNRRPADYELAGTPLNDRAGGESLAIEISPAPWPSSGAKYLSSIAAFVPWPNISPNLRTIFRWKGEVGASSSNPLCSTFQSLDFRTSRRIDRNERACAICDHAWTQRTPSAALIRRIQQNLSGRDSARSADHRL